MKELLEFLSLSDPNVRYVVLGSVLLGISAAIVGVFTFLRKRALVGDAVAHSVLPGVALAFILFETKSPLVLLAGAMATGWISLISIDVITRHSRIKTDTAIGLVLSVFFGIGILLLTAIQHSGSAAQSGLDKFLFGKAASLIGDDLITFSIISILLIVVVIFFFKEFALISFDPEHAKVIGLPVKLLEFILATITVLAIATGIQAVGVVLMAAMLITPATAARYWTDKLSVMVLLAAIFGAIAGISGSYVSYIAPSMPTGPWIVMVISFIALISLMLAPGRGFFSRYLSKRSNKMKILDENILKEFYRMAEDKGDYNSWRTTEELQLKRSFGSKLFSKRLRSLKRRNLIEKQDEKYALTETGKKEGQRITRLHRLWELYLTTYLRIAPDHVHEDAEAIEHVITPEIEEKLEKVLKYPELDPHARAIPGKIEDK